MTKKALILTVNPEITAIIASKNECASCQASCSKKKNIISLSNTSNLSLKENSIVLITSEKKYQYIQGFLALLLPVILAFAGYFLANPIMSLFRASASEGIKSIFVLAFFTITCAIIFIITRFSPLPGKPQVLEIIE